MEDTNLCENENFFMGTKEASKLWGVSQNTITKWCREGRIDGELSFSTAPFRNDGSEPQHKEQYFGEVFYRK